jgi:hypothetical protein
MIFEQLKKTSYQASLAFGFTPHEAEALSQYYLRSNTTTSHHLKSNSVDKNQVILQDLPLSSLFDLQGLSPWTETNEVWKLIEYLNSLGFETIGQIYWAHWPLEDWMAHWGKLGYILYQKLFSTQYDSLIPLYEPHQKELRGYQYYERPIHNFEWLRQEILSLIEKALTRLQSLKKHSKSLRIICYHEFERKKSQWSIESLKPSWDLSLWDKLIQESLLNKPNLDNPIEEIEVLFQLEKIEYSQPSLFESSSLLNESKMQIFLSWLKQKGVTFGFLESKPHPFFDYQSKLSYPPPKIDSNPYDSKLFWEPTYLLKNPIRLSPHELNHLVLHPQINERFDTEEPYSYKRHYFLARNPKSQWMWIFYNPLDQGFYLHGYFD